MEIGNVEWMSITDME
jgi:hypothetical protein